MYTDLSYPQPCPWSRPVIRSLFIGASPRHATIASKGNQSVMVRALAAYALNVEYLATTVFETEFGPQQHKEERRRIRRVARVVQNESWPRHYL